MSRGSDREDIKARDGGVMAACANWNVGKEVWGLCEEQMCLVNCHTEVNYADSKAAVDPVIADVEGEECGSWACGVLVGEVGRLSSSKMIFWPSLGSEARLKEDNLGGGDCGDHADRIGTPRKEKALGRLLWDSTAWLEEGPASEGICPKSSLGRLGEV